MISIVYKKENYFALVGKEKLSYNLVPGIEKIRAST